MFVKLISHSLQHGLVLETKMFTVEWKIDIERKKLVDYLISLTHPVGRSKAKFFRAIGFNEDSVDLLQSCLEAMARSEETIERIDTPYGAKHVIEGVLDTPSGKQVIIRTIWMESQNKVLRFITAYPVRERQ